MHFLILAVMATAPTSQDNWTAWQGCWRAEGAPADELVCITPDRTGVRVATMVDGVVRDESRIIADGFARQVRPEGCAGNERARWSKDGRRVLLDSDLTCGRDRRTVRGMFVFVAPNEWLSVQSATSGDSVATTIVRFVAADPARATSNAAFVANRGVSDAMFEVDESDVNEAIAHIGETAVQEWMREAGEPFQLGYQTQGTRATSALDQTGRFSNPVQREVVRVVERPVYVHNTYYERPYGWYYSPWGHYHRHHWHWYHRPVVVVRLPIVIYRNHHYRRDWYVHRVRYDRDRYDRRDYGRNDRDRYDRDRYDRDNDYRSGRATRDGYSSGRRATSPNQGRTDTPVSPRTETRRETRDSPSSDRQVTRRATRGTRASSAPPQRSSGSVQPQRSSGTTQRATTATRTAKSRGTARSN